MHANRRGQQAIVGQWQPGVIEARRRRFGVDERSLIRAVLGERYACGLAYAGVAGLDGFDPLGELDSAQSLMCDEASRRSSNFKRLKNGIPTLFKSPMQQPLRFAFYINGYLAVR